MVTRSTMLNMERLAMANTFQTKKSLFSPDGNIAKRHAHIPMAQAMLMSFEERRFIMRIISGMFQRGITIEAIKAILSIIMPFQHCLVRVRFCACTSLLILCARDRGICAGRIPLEN